MWKHAHRLFLRAKIEPMQIKCIFKYWAMSLNQYLLPISVTSSWVFPNWNPNFFGGGDPPPLLFRHGSPFPINMWAHSARAKNCLKLFQYLPGYKSLDNTKHQKSFQVLLINLFSYLTKCFQYFQKYYLMFQSWSFYFFRFLCPFLGIISDCYGWC